jgi:hypothetical protein
MIASLGDYFDDESIKKIIGIQTEVGSIYLTDFGGEDEGFVLKAGNKRQSKFFIIIGNDAEGNAMGVIFVNTEPHPRVSYEAEFINTQYYILKRVYPDFLEYDSYVDCSQIRRLDNLRMQKCQFVGALIETDLEIIMDILINSETIPLKQKKKYGITL